jgi:CRISPR-associated protein Cst1
MKQDISTINYDWLTQVTGDPFADVGGFVIKYLAQKHQEKGVLELVEYITKIYVKDWDNNLHSFFLNSTITHNSNKGQKGIDKTVAYYKSLIEEQTPVQEGYCRITGQKTKLFFAGRDNHIMSGSGTLINFHHAFQSGILLSKEALIRMLFVPLGLIQLGNKVALIYSNNDEVTQFFVDENCRNNIRDLASGQSQSIQRSDFNNPANAIFAFADKCIDTFKTATYDAESGKSNTAGITLNLYHFTNFGASPDIQLHTLPATVFAFYATCLKGELKKDWQRFVKNSYSNSKFKNAHFNETTDSWESSKETAGYEAYRTWRNRIYEKLMYDQSILREMLYWSIKKSFDFKIVELYQINLRNMDKRSIQKIKQLADYIVLGQEKDVVKKSITKLNGTKSSHDIRFFLLKLMNNNYQKGNQQPLFTLEEYVDYLFPDGTSWREIRDLLLIAIYQKLHETKLSLEIELPEEETENESETINN